MNKNNPRSDKNTNEEEIKKKFESFNESKLGNTAVTFKAEAISRDLKEFIKLKSIFNTKAMGHVSVILSSLATSDKKLIDTVFSKTSSINKLFNLLSEEIEGVNQIMNLVISDLLIEEGVLKEAKKKLISTNSVRKSPKRETTKAKE